MAARSACILFVTLAVLVAAPAGAEIYKWTDAQGRVHFGDRPTDGKQAQPVEVHDYKPGTDEAVRQVYERNDRLQKAKNAGEPQRRQEAARKNSERALTCEKANERLRNISGRVQFVDDDGKPVATTERERAALQREVESWIGENCR